MPIFDNYLTANFSFAGKMTVEAVSRTMNEATFEEIYERTARPLWSYVSRISGNSGLADDIAQETFLRYLRSPLKDTDDAGIKSYLYKIATNLVYDHFRKTQRENKWRLFPATEPASETVYETFAEETDMMRVFQNLKPQERALLWLAYVEGYEHREIAVVLNLSAVSIKVLLFRARRRLAQLLESEKI
ncbi:MAG: RNA polymerase sigma factor [Pyrinomonadaceae bacterium]|nr:RNA polymerase sigma factor [Pyrinomonadaceae bacterium]